MNKLRQVTKSPIKTLAIGAGKGGVGKSTFTVGLALTLKNLSLNVGVLDADLYGPSLSLLLPPQTPPSMTESGKIIPAISKGIKVVSLSHYKQGQEAAMVRAPIANATIEKFVKDVDWGDVDIVLIDLPPGTGDIQLTLMQNIPLTAAIAITTPAKIATIDVKKAIDLFKQMEVEVLGVVENMSYLQDSLTMEKYFPFGQGGGKKLAEDCKIPLLGTIPLDEELSSSLDAGRSFFETPRVTIAKKAFEEIAIEIRSKICDDISRTKKIEKVTKKSDHSFEVVGRKQKLVCRFRDVQKACPCARCRDEVTGMSLVDPETIDDNLDATEVRLIGNYAIKFSFTSGCSQGIYTWDQLEKLSSHLQPLS